MTKTKNPLLSLEAIGSIAKRISFTRRRHQSIAEAIPIPVDAKSPEQLAWRPMFLKCVDLWHTLNAAEKETWESLARPKHMTGYAWYLSQCLRPNPGIYLPLVGGTMQGDIDMDTNAITDLPDPTANQDADTKAARNLAIATYTHPPQAHNLSHQDTGTDEISVTGLSGLLADDQHVLDAEVTAVAIAKALLTEQGDLIYASAPSTPAALPHGTLGQLLQSGGHGANPSWTKAVTKEFFIPVTQGAEDFAYGNYPTIRLTADTESAYMSFFVPNDFTSIVAATIVLLCTTSYPAAHWHIYTHYAAVSQSYDTHSQQDTTTEYSILSDKWTEISISSLLTSLAAGDFVGIKLLSQSNTRVYHILGVRFRYT